MRIISYSGLCILIALMAFDSRPANSSTPNACIPPGSTVVPTCNWPAPIPGTSQYACNLAMYAAQGNVPTPPTETYCGVNETIAYPGTSKSNELELPNGDCYYINNATTKPVFIPLNSQSEWISFKTKALANQINGISLTTCNPVGGTPHLCGVQNGVPSQYTPTSGLCAAGSTASVVTVNSACAGFSWSCTQGTQSSQCSAAQTATTGIVPGVTQLVVVLDASGSMGPLIASAANAASLVIDAAIVANPNLQIEFVVFGGSGWTGIPTATYPTPTSPATSPGGAYTVTPAGVNSLTTSGAVGANGAARSVCYMGTVFQTGNAANPTGFGISSSTIRDGNSSPIAASIAYGAQYLNPVANKTAMVVITDGLDTCNGDLAGEIAAQKANGTLMFGVAYQSSAFNAANFANFNQWVTADDATSVQAALTTAINTTQASSCPTTVPTPPPPPPPPPPTPPTPPSP